MNRLKPGPDDGTISIAMIFFTPFALFAVYGITTWGTSFMRSALDGLLLATWFAIMIHQSPPRAWWPRRSVGPLPNASGDEVIVGWRARRSR